MTVYDSKCSCMRICRGGTTRESYWERESYWVRTSEVTEDRDLTGELNRSDWKGSLKITEEKMNNRYHWIFGDVAEKWFHVIRWIIMCSSLYFSYRSLEANFWSQNFWEVQIKNEAISKLRTSPFQTEIIEVKLTSYTVEVIPQFLYRWLKEVASATEEPVASAACCGKVEA